MAGSYTQTQAELEKHWQEQLDFISRSADAYDEGHAPEAKRIALAVRVLFHQTGSSTSLMQQLKMTNVQLYDSSVKLPPGVTFQTYTALTSRVMLPNTGAMVVPNLDNDVGNAGGLIDFQDWWNGLVFTDNQGNPITRKMLVLSVSNQDGGAHVDPTVNEIYAGLSRDNSLKQIYMENGKFYPIEGEEMAALRQIGHEVLKTFVPGYQRFLKVPVGSSPAIGNIGISIVPAKDKE